MDLYEIKKQNKRRKLILVQFASNMAGVAGFEPTNDGVRGLKTNFTTTIYSV